MTLKRFIMIMLVAIVIGYGILALLMSGIFVSKWTKTDEFIIVTYHTEINGSDKVATDTLPLYQHKETGEKQTRSSKKNKLFEAPSVGSELYKEGHPFKGWIIDHPDFTDKIFEGGERYPSGLTSGVNVYSSWGEPNVYEISFKGEGGTTPEKIHATYGYSYPTMNISTRTGNWTFAGWFTIPNGPEDTRITDSLGNPVAGKTVTGDITLFAKWIKDVITPDTAFKINFIYTGASMGGITHFDGNKDNLMASLNVDPYRPIWSDNTKSFAGWYYKHANGSEEQINYVSRAKELINSSNQVTLFAKWSDETPITQHYTVTYNATANGGSVQKLSDTVPQGYSVILPTPTHTSGYTFNGWYSQQTGGTRFGGAGSTYTPISNMTMYAQWSTNPVTQYYTVNYNATANGGSVQKLSDTVPQGYSVTLPTPTHTSGYTFNGWYSQQTGGTRFGGAGSTYTPTSNMTMYAQWSSGGTEPVVNSITVKFDVGYATYDGVPNPAQHVSTKTSANYTFTTPVWKRVFLGWYYFDGVHSDGVKVSNTNELWNMGAPANVMLIAKWALI